MPVMVTEPPVSRPMLYEEAPIVSEKLLATPGKPSSRIVSNCAGRALKAPNLSEFSERGVEPMRFGGNDSHRGIPGWRPEDRGCRTEPGNRRRSNVGSCEGFDREGMAEGSAFLDSASAISPV